MNIYDVQLMVKNFTGSTKFRVEYTLGFPPVAPERWCIFGESENRKGFYVTADNPAEDISKLKSEYSK